MLESSATKRDAKAYLQTFGASQPGPKKTPAFTTVLHDGIAGSKNVPRFVQGPVRVSTSDTSEVPHVAIVKLRDPQTWDDALLNGVTKILTQLRDLGLRSVIVLDCDLDQSHGSSWQKVVSQQADRILQAIGRYGSPGAELVDSGIRRRTGASQNGTSFGSKDLFVGFGRSFTTPLKHGHILVVPPRALSEETLGYTPTDPNDIIFTLTNYFSGLQFDQPSSTDKKSDGEIDARPSRHAVVDRIIVIDPSGGIPLSGQGDGARVFVNLEEEFDSLRAGLAHNEPRSSQSNTMTGQSGGSKPKHMENLKLVKDTLAILPSTASAIITSPLEAANLRAPPTKTNDGNVEIAGEVKTRRWQNPLIHNLLTDRPIYSASLPIGRIKPTARGANAETVLSRSPMPTTTLAKKGLPVTIFPDPRAAPWLPPQPGTPRLRLTDTCIDLPRLVYLINDSFNRKLDVEHYLRRVEDSLAGIIIAGEYEGGAILTWERPFGMSEEAAYRSGRLVPYLDKFAVLKKSQGAGGVADIVFNAMVRDCFPLGVCWRSRKNNPVNKWYFERSCGVRKLPESNWAMFWTTPEAATSDMLMRDYEDVCRGVVPSWEDGKPAD